MSPALSVLLPFRNAAETIGAAITSILEDGFESLEVLAVDDGSEDDSRRVIEAIDHRVRVLESPARGLVPALEHGRRHASAPFIARMDADDVTLPGRFGAQVHALQSSPRLGVVGSFSRTLGGGEGLRLYVEWQNALITPEDHTRELFIESPLCHPSTMFRDEAVEEVGGYSHGDFPEDYDLWLRLWDAGWELAKVPQLGVEWRHVEGRATFNDPRYRPDAFLALKVRTLAKRLAAETRALAVWGAGRTGRRMMRALESHGPRVQLWIDIDPAKIGRTARGAPIHDPAVLDPASHFVLGAVGARGARALIREALAQRGFVEGRDALFVA